MGIRRAVRYGTIAAFVAVSAAGAGATVDADGGGRGGRSYEPGAPGIGDPYFPLDGNGGYDVDHYDLAIRYDPATDAITAEATIAARATHGLSSFNLDLEGLTVRAVSVDGRAATWQRAGGELTVVPRRGIDAGRRFTVVVRYDGVPATLQDEFGDAGFVHTDDGALVAGQPDSAATWYPVNDHPSDRATYSFEITAPAGLEVLANGVLRGERTHRGWTTWTWVLREPMAPYLAMMAIGEFDVEAFRDRGVRYWDAIDPVMLLREAPHSGARMAVSGVGDLTYKRLARTISVPADGAELSFWLDRDVEPSWDHIMVEAHTVGADDWTTLPDVNGHTSQDTGLGCPYWLGLHPFLAHYQTPTDDGSGCTASGTSGEWWAATGRSDGWEQWQVDLSRFAGRTVEVAISHVSDDVIQRRGVVVDDIEVSTGEGSTSFEADGDELDGWSIPGAPDGSAPNVNDWAIGGSELVAPALGETARSAFDRLPEMLAFMGDTFGRYPFSAAGGVFDDVPGLSFALETQTRPVYGPDFFYDTIDAEMVVLHENAHQWFGDALPIAQWRDIWLNEGFATYAEWLWAEHDGVATADQMAEQTYRFVEDVEPFWAIPIGDPGPVDLFDVAVYWRGALTLHALRAEVGDAAFFRILRTWVREQSGTTVHTAEFIDLAERIAGRPLDALFDTWLFSPQRPELPVVGGPTATTATQRTADAPAVGTSQRQPARR